MDSRSIIQPSSNIVSKYMSWGSEYVTTLGSTLKQVGTEMYNSNSIIELKDNLIQGLWTHPRNSPQNQTKWRFNAVKNHLNKNETIPEIETVLYINFEGPLAIQPILHRTHIITNQEMITGLLHETRGGKLLEFGDYNIFNAIMGSRNMLLSSHEDHSKLRKPLEQSFTHKSISSEVMTSKIFETAKSSIVDKRQALFTSRDYWVVSSDDKLEEILIGKLDTPEIGASEWDHIFQKFVTGVVLELTIGESVDAKVLNEISNFAGKLLTNPDQETIMNLTSLIKSLPHLNASESSLITKIEELEKDAQFSSLFLILLAGTATTKESLNSLMYFIIMHPEYKDQIVNKFKEMLLDEGMDPTVLDHPFALGNHTGEEVKNAVIKFVKRNDTMLHYCYLEMLRLAPAIPVIRRIAKEDFNIGNTIVFKGDMIELNIMAAQRDKKIWGADANQFNPERFQQDPDKQKLLNTFSRKIPCLGKNLAEMEIKMMGMLFCTQAINLRKNVQDGRTMVQSLTNGFTLTTWMRNL